MKNTLIICLGLLLSAAASQAQLPDYEYFTNADGASLTILVYNGQGGDVTIPGAFEGLPVTSISQKAFEETALTSVVIPPSVTNIGNWTFYSCSSLTSVTIPDSVTSIGDSAFDYCTSLISVTIPDGVTSIGNGAFADCVSLSSVTIPGGVTNIGDSAFFECESLANVTIPASLASLGVTAFYGCTSLSSATIPGGVTNIGSMAFESCISLTNVTMSNGVANIAEGAFNFCTSLATVTIPGTVTNIGAQAFSSCAELTTVVIPASVLSITNNAFYDCSGLFNVYFLGNAPVPGTSVFLYDTNAKAYYLPHTTGWGSAYAGIPAELTPTNIIKLAFSPPRAGVTLTGAGHYLRGSDVTVTATTDNDCYEFIDWTSAGKKVSTNSQYSFVVTNKETLVANFALLQYTISTSSSPANGGIVGGGGKKSCGSTVILTATPKPGFVFTGWTNSLGATITNAHYKFSAAEDESFVANFTDIRSPTIKITAPIARERVNMAAFTIKGTASDNAGVAAVYYQLNNDDWQPVSSGNGFKTWSAVVALTPNSTNYISAYAVDVAGHASTNGPIQFLCSAQGAAAVSIEGEVAEVVFANDYFPVSFDSSVYVKMPANANDGGEVGSYTYTRTGPDTAELVSRRLLPKLDDGPNGSVLELTFADAYNAAFTNLAGGSGTFSFAPAEESVPAALEGTVAVTSSFVNSNAFSTNSFGKSTFTTTDSLGGNSSGTYKFTKLTPVAALLMETYSSPTEKMGTTNLTILTFAEGAVRGAGVYYTENRDVSGKLSSDIGSFR